MSAMSPRLQMMVAFAAASLQARVSKYSDTTYPASPAAIQSAWTDAQIMMGHMPEEVRKELDAGDAVKINRFPEG